METNAGAEQPRRLFVYNAGFLTQKRIRRILTLSGYKLRIGLPHAGDTIGTWGHSPTAHRGEAIAAKRNTPIIRVEDAFLRSIHSGRSGEAPLGLTIDTSGMHYDPAQPSDLENLLASHPLDDTDLLNRARGGIARLREADLSKYNSFDPDEDCPPPGYVLVIDQTLNDAAVLKSNADRARFLEMLVYAQEEHPGQRILIKTHPDTREGHRSGYFKASDATGLISLLSTPVSPWALLDGAIAVYTVSSQMGFEAILAGHKPRVFGQPFYAGWGLSQDEAPLTRRQRTLTRPQLFAGAMMLYPKWYDPYRDQLCSFETALENLAARTRAFRQDRSGWAASGMRLWKRSALQKTFGQRKPILFTDNEDKIRTALESGRKHMVWASSKAPRTTQSASLEDGFIRSNGLGATLTPPMSLVLDHSGIYYDPTQPSSLEAMVLARIDLRPDQWTRIRNVMSSLKKSGLTKYNVGLANPLDLPDGHRILVPGQVENDASIMTGTRDVTTNADLLRAARNAHPDAVLLYKPHPDVEAGLRPGHVPDETLDELNAHVLRNLSADTALQLVNEVWTMTSLMGFEALLRDIPVTCLGAPFYAGWGLTDDLGPVPARRGKNASLESLAHATLIDYPRYFDPQTGSPCPVEVVIERLANGTAVKGSYALRLLSKLQGVFASQAHLWRG